MRCRRLVKRDSGRLIFVTRIQEHNIVETGLVNPRRFRHGRSLYRKNYPTRSAKSSAPGGCSSDILIGKEKKKLGRGAKGHGVNLQCHSSESCLSWVDVYLARFGWLRVLDVL